MKKEDENQRRKRKEMNFFVGFLRGFDFFFFFLVFGTRCGYFENFLA